jgi:hypothetical protein
MEEWLAVKQKIIDDFRKIDTNSQKVDVLGQDSLVIMREQHNDDRKMIVDLQNDLESCRSNQKWIAGISAIGGGFIGYKIRGAGQFQNPLNIFIPNSTNPGFVKIEDPFQQSLRKALNNLKQ